METFTDSAGVTCRYTAVEELQPGDTVIIGWRTEVERVEREGEQARVWWKGWPHPDKWLSLGTKLPVEVDERR